MIVPYPTGLEPKDGQNGNVGQHGGSMRVKSALRIAGIRLAIDASFTVFSAYLARRTGLPQYVLLAWFAALLLPIDLAGLWLIRKNRETQGITILSLGWLGLFLVMDGLFSGLGVVLGLAAVLSTAAVTLPTLPARGARSLIGVGILAGAAIAVLDEMIQNTSRASAPVAIQTALVGLVVLLLVVILSLLFSRYAAFTLRSKLVIAFLSVSLIPLGVLALVNGRSTRQALTDAANQALFAAAAKTAANVDAYIQENLDSIQTEAQIPLFRQYVELAGDTKAENELAPAVIELLDALEGKDLEHIFSYSLLDKDGLVLASTALPTGSRPQFMENDSWMQNNFRLVLLTNYASVSPVKYSLDMGIASLYFTARVSDSEGKPIGGLIAHYDARVLQDLVEQNNNLAGSDSFGVLFDEEQIHLAHGTRPDTIQKTVGPLASDKLARLIEGYRLPNLPPAELTTDLPELAASLENAAREPFFTAIDVATGDRLNQVAVANLVSQNGWVVAFFQPEDVYLAPVARQNRNTLIFGALIASLVITAALGAAQLIADPISRLTRVAVQLADGELEARMPVESTDEIGTLAGTFNTMADQLKTTLTGLEDEVATRTADLNRRAAQLQTAAQVAREAASIRDIGQLLEQVTRLISNRFDYYHCGIFLLDEKREYAILRAASSAGGAKMLARKHKLAVGKIGIVGFVAEAKKPRIALDVGADAVYFDNPDLPLTRSEMALPLMIANQVIGVLDVQSKNASAFTDEDVEVLQILADQIALAIDNVRLLSASRKALQELENLYKRQVQQAWRNQLKNQPIAYRYDRVEVTPAEPSPSLGPVKQGPNGHPDAPGNRILTRKISLRGQEVGSVILRRDDDQHPWSQEEAALAEDVIRQLSLALENTRLYEETQQRAERERLISEVSTAIRRTLDIDTVLHTAAQEIQTALNLEQVDIRVGRRHLQAAKRGTGELRSEPANPVKVDPITRHSRES